jgi:tetratricopeptide (TPR) repeat protein
MSSRSVVRVTVLSLTLFLTIFLVSSRLAAFPPRPLSKSELIALVAGRVVPENTVFEIRSRGLGFVPDMVFSGMVKQAGADSRVFAALAAAKTSPAGERASEDSAELLRHLTNAGQLIRQSKLDAAARELNVALATSSAKSQIGFVMGHLLSEQGDAEQALRVYRQILEDQPDFPEVHTRLSYCYHAVGDGDSALREAKAALAKNADDPVAHLNAGIVLLEMGKTDAAKAEFQESIRSKPDYVLAYLQMGNLLGDLHDPEGAVVMYKKAIALKPNDALAHYNLGVVYGEKQDYISAIREYREAKRLDPNRLDVRQNLGSALMHTDPGAAITEMRELVAIAPDYPICHVCLGGALSRVGRVQEAEKEFRIAMSADPGNPAVHVQIGAIREYEKNYDAALAEYRKAAALNDPQAYGMIGRALLLKKDFSAAVNELKRAEQFEPANWQNHELHGEALQGLGDRDGALVEYKQAISLAPKEPAARLNLALVQEQQGDWILALGNFRQAALDEPPLKPDGAARPFYDAQSKFDAAQERFEKHLAELRAAGKAADATALESRWRASVSAPNLDAQFHDAMQASAQAAQAQRFDEAETSAKEAISIAEKIAPQDARLAEAYGQLGNVYAWRLDYPKAGQAYERQLALSEGAYGRGNPANAAPLRNLAMLALAQKDYSQAEKFFQQTYELNQNAFGENSAGTADALRGLAHVYQSQQDYGKAETALLRATKIYETMFGKESMQFAVPLTALCNNYDQWQKPEKSAACHGELVALGEKLFGASSPYLVRDLTAEAQALRQLGRTEEAVKLEQRTQTISAQASPN